jgi:hypothetical protein
MELLDTRRVYWCIVHTRILIWSNFLCMLDFQILIEVFSFLPVFDRWKFGYCSYYRLKVIECLQSWETRRACRSFCSLWLKWLLFCRHSCHVCIFYIHVFVCACVRVLEPFTSEHLVCSRRIGSYDRPKARTVTQYCCISGPYSFVSHRHCKYINFYVNKQPVLATHCRAVKTQVFQFTSPYNTSRFTVPLLCISLLLAPTCFCVTAIIRELTSILLLGCEIHGNW